MSFPLITGMVVALIGSQFVRIYAHQSDEFADQWLGAAAWYLLSICLGVLASVLTLRATKSPCGRAAPFWVLVVLLSAYSLILANILLVDRASSAVGYLLAPIGITAGFAFILKGLSPTSRHAIVRGACFIIVFSTVGSDAADWMRIVTADHHLGSPQVTNTTAPPQPPTKIHVFEILLDAMPGYDYVHHPELARQAFFATAPAGIYYPNAYSNGHLTAVSKGQIFSGRFLGPEKGSKSLFERLAEVGYKVNFFSEVERGSCPSTSYASCYTRKWALESGMFEDHRAQYVLFQMRQLLNAYFMRINLAALNRGVPSSGNWRVTDRREPMMWGDGGSASLILFREFIRNLDSLAGPSYNFLHLKLPHAPIIHDRDCNVVGDESEVMMDVWSLRARGASEQALCANKLAKTFLDELQKRGLFDSSLIVIHSDHGSGPGYLNFVKESRSYGKEIGFSKDEIVEMRSRALLWIKPPHFPRSETREHTALLLDIPATLTPALGVSLDRTDGMDLLADFSPKRARALASRAVYAMNNYRTRSGEMSSYYLRRLPSGAWQETTREIASLAAQRGFVHPPARTLRPMVRK